MSRILIVSTFGPNGPKPHDLCCGVISALGQPGMQLVRDAPHLGMMKFVDGRSASIALRQRSEDVHDIEVIIDSSLAVQALALIELWHRDKYGDSDHLQVSARIR